jgi:cell wall assembly regulator SMI1
VRANLWWFLTALVHTAWLPVEVLSSQAEGWLSGLSRRYVSAEVLDEEWGSEFGYAVLVESRSAYADVGEFLQPVGWVAVCVLAALACRPGTARTQLLLGTLTVGVLLAEFVLYTLVVGRYTFSWYEQLIYCTSDVLRLVAVPVLAILATRAGLWERSAWTLTRPPRAIGGAAWRSFWRRRSVRVVAAVLVLAALVEGAAVLVLAAQEGDGAVMPPAVTEPAEAAATAAAVDCDPMPRAPAVRRPKAAATRRVDAAWHRIERRLARWAPKTYRRLNPPASPQALARAEAALGRRLPDELKASLLRHDGGQFILWWLYEPIGVDEIVQDWRRRCEIARDAPWSPDDYPDADADPEGLWWHGGVVPFTRDGGGNSLVIDRKGRVGEFSHEVGLSFGGDTGWRSYAAFLEDVADSLESGEPLRDSPPSVRAGGLEWGSM